ncbi:signal transduction histidine kinase [Nocardioides ginsengisegetis]|uniref:Signal transduction histidine kinase n=1 Tax=Nocardioides ginsengisegetis TaxID=661491 RepID=A0A7W3J0V8_9ACTN|nr:sensor histidine kinase [Nocardioides ginsengisegetis]MBA8804069.1 signal transduction histidine kinase [Nocardioides ginsengisegetis]
MATAPPAVIRDRRLALLGWLLAALALALMASVPLSVSGGVNERPGVRAGYPVSEWLAHTVIVAVLVGSGAWLTQLRPRNAIGWILLASGVLQGIQTGFDAYGIRAVTDPDRSLPLARTIAWIAQWTWIPALLVIVTILPIVYPTGRPSSRFWHRHLQVTVVGLVFLVSAAALAFGAGNDSVTDAPEAFHAPLWLVVPLAAVGIAVTAAATAVTLVGTVVRTFRATSPERQQLAMLVGIVTLMVPTAFLSQPVFGFVYAAVPVAVTVGVLRYNLLGIEVVVRRTLLYVPLTLLVALVVGLTTATLARLVPDGPLPLVVASALVAVLIFPVSGLLRRTVDRLVLGERADPLEQVAGVGAGVSEPMDDPVTSMLTAVAAATGATYAAVLDDGGTPTAELGDRSGQPHTVALRHGHHLLGSLLIGPRPAERRVSGADARLVDALAPHLAMVVWSVRLTEALDEERDRVTRATLAERDRLRRDLHDGLGPSLSGIALGLEAASHALVRDPEGAAAILSRTRDEADSAVREIRRVIDGLRPRVLDERGLTGAVRETATGLGLGRPGGIRFALHATPLPDLPPQVEEAAFRIVAEGLTNVVRHSAARHCTVLLSCTGSCLELGIEDDGTGLSGGGRRGHGLDSMQRRASALGGRLVVSARAPHGTHVNAVIPWGAS